MTPLEVILGLFIGGILLILFEIIFPGGVLGALGVVLVIVGTFYSGKHLGPWQASILFVASVAIVSIAFYIFYRSPFGRVMILDDQLKGSDLGLDVKEGLTGIALTDLRPSGKALFAVDGKERPFDVLASGDFLAKGTEVLVSKIEGQKIIVHKKGAP